MEYDDDKISTPDEFDKISKEYEERKFQSIDLLFEKLFLLNEIYSFVERNIRNFRLREIFRELKKQISLDIEDLSKLYSQNKNNPPQFKRFRNYFYCLRLILKTEAEFLELSIENGLPNEIILEHIEIIKQLSKLI